jgi:cytochrome c oxidase subunit IV
LSYFIIVLFTISYPIVHINEKSRHTLRLIAENEEDILDGILNSKNEIIDINNSINKKLFIVEILSFKVTAIKKEAIAPTTLITLTGSNPLFILKLMIQYAIMRMAIQRKATIGAIIIPKTTTATKNTKTNIMGISKTNIYLSPL